MSIVGSQTVVDKVITSWNGSIPFRVHFTRPGARFSKVPITLRSWKAILCARCLH